MRAAGSPSHDEYALLEFALEWPGLHGVEAQLAEALRLFVINRDPLDWLSNRGCAWATANADGDTLELPVYITRDKVQRQVQADRGRLETTLGTVGESVLVAATQCQGSIFAGAYPDLAFRGEVPRLLDQPAGSGSLGAPEIAEAAAQMCDAHRSEASIVTASRIGRARASNRAGPRLPEQLLLDQIAAVDAGRMTACANVWPCVCT